MRTGMTKGVRAPAYELHEEFDSRNQTPGRAAGSVWGLGARKVSGITIHHWGAPGQNFWAVNSYLCTNTVPTSAHFVVQQGLVSCIVSPDDCAWHGGHPEANSHTIGLECRPEATAGDHSTTAELIAFLWGIYGVVPLYPHSFWAPTACPGNYDLTELERLAHEFYEGIFSQEPAPSPTTAAPYVPDPHWILEPGETLADIARYFGVDVASIAAYNQLADPDVLQPGQLIWPPTGRTTYVVRPGDSPSGIAATFGITVEELCYANGINDPRRLQAGVRLQIPW